MISSWPSGSDELALLGRPSQVKARSEGYLVNCSHLLMARTDTHFKWSQPEDGATDLRALGQIDCVALHDHPTLGEEVGA
jgi:hypothetical protein